MPPLRSVVYVSTAIHKFSDAELEALLTEARTQNQRSGITGILLYYDGNFMQCFEGPEEAVAATYDRIRTSKRHTDVVVLLDEPVAERHFESWDMGLAHPSASELLKLSTAQWKRQASTPNESALSSPGLWLLQMFWRDARA